jgi:glycosyltransferase involved in cell wall biosynthesis
MNLALVHDWLTGMRGGEKCLEPLCRRYPHARLFTLLRRPGAAGPVIDGMRTTTSFLQHVPGATRHYRHLLPLMPRAIERLRIPPEVDLVLSFSHAVAKSIIPPPGVPHVCYCFTPMRYAWDLREDYFPTSGSANDGDRPGDAPPRVLAGKLRGTPLSALRNVLLDRLRDWDRATCDRVTHYVAISRTVRERIARCYGRDSQIIFPPVDTDYYTPADVPREDFYLCVSALAPYKRLDLAVAACERLGRRLIVIGAGPAHRQLDRLRGERTRLLGWQPNEVIRDHLRRCRALLFPGHEDFGIVPLEAHACGAPVIALDRGGATETVVPPTTARPGTGMFFSEPTIDSLCEAMERLEREPERFCPQLARQQAERFATDRYERELVAFVEGVARERAGTVAAH